MGSRIIIAALLIWGHTEAEDTMIAIAMEIKEIGQLYNNKRFSVVLGVDAHFSLMSIFSHNGFAHQNFDTLFDMHS